MDTADLAVALIEQRLENHLKHHQLNSTRQTNPIKPEGYCHSCYEEVSGNQLFCNGKCAAKFHK